MKVQVQLPRQGDGRNYTLCPIDNGPVEIVDSDGRRVCMVEVGQSVTLTPIHYRSWPQRLVAWLLKRPAWRARYYTP